MTRPRDEHCDDPKTIVDARIIELARHKLTTGAIAMHGTIKPYLTMLIPPEEQERVAFMAYVRRVIESRTVKDKKGHSVRMFNSVIQRRITEDGEIIEEMVYELAILIEEQPEKARKAFRTFCSAILGALRRCPLLDAAGKEEALDALATIFERAERRLP